MVTFSLPVWAVVLSLVMLLVLCVAGGIGLTVLMRQFLQGVPDFQGSVPINDIDPEAYAMMEPPPGPVDEQTRRDLFAIARDELGARGNWRKESPD